MKKRKNKQQLEKIFNSVGKVIRASVTRRYDDGSYDLTIIMRRAVNKIT